jgi:formiminoglutamase
VESVLDVLLASGKVALVELAECCPRLDLDGRTARVAARLAARAARG